MRRILALIILFSAAMIVTAQQPPHPAVTGQTVKPKEPYDSTKAQLYAEKEKNLQLEAAQATTTYQSSMRDLQTKFADLDGKLNVWIVEVRKANGWDDTYTYNRESDTWKHNDKPPSPPAAKK